MMTYIAFVMSYTDIMFFCSIFLIELYTVLYAFVTFNKKD